MFPPPLSFRQRGDLIFADAAMSVSLSNLLGLVHVAGLAADEGFVHFDFASGPAKFHECTSLQRQSNPMKHEPCRLLSNTERPRNLATANAIRAIDDHPKGCHPLVDSERGILKDRSDFDGELLIAPRQSQRLPRLDEVIAVRRDNAGR